MPTVQELTQKYRRLLPKTERFKAHAVNLACLAFYGNVEQAYGYLNAMQTDWDATSKYFDVEKFDAFCEDVLEDATAAADELAEA